MARCNGSNASHRPSFSSSQGDDSSVASSSFSEDPAEQTRGRQFLVAASPSPRLPRSALKGVTSDLDKFICDSDEEEDELDFGKAQTLRQEAPWHRSQRTDIRQVKVILGTNDALEDEDDDTLIPKPLSYGRGEADDMHGRTPLASPKGAGLGIAPALPSSRQDGSMSMTANARVFSHPGDGTDGRASNHRHTSPIVNFRAREDQAFPGPSPTLDRSRPRSYTLAVDAPPAASPSPALHYARRPSTTSRPTDVPLRRPSHARLPSASYAPFLTPPLSPAMARDMSAKTSSTGYIGTTSPRSSFSNPPASPKIKRRSTVTGKSTLASQGELLPAPGQHRDSRQWSGGRQLRTDMPAPWQGAAPSPSSPTLSTHKRRTRHQRSQASISSTVSSTSNHSGLLPWLAYYPTANRERAADTVSFCSNEASSEDHSSDWATSRTNRSRSEADLLPAVTTKVCAVAKVQVQPPAGTLAAERRSSQSSTNSSSEKWQVSTDRPVSPLGWLRPPPSLGRGRSQSDTRGMMESVEQVLRAL